MDVFRINDKEGKPSRIKRAVFGIIILSIVVSFVWQISVSICPVP